MASWSDKFAQVTQSAISKSKEVAGVTKLNMEISSLNQEIRNIQMQAGAYVLDNGFLYENPYIVDWAEKVRSLRAEIEGKNEKIMELRNMVVCSGCGREVSRSNRFCEHCGTEIVIKAPAAEEEPQGQEVQAETAAPAAPAEAVAPMAPAESEAAVESVEIAEKPAEDSIGTETAE